MNDTYDDSANTDSRLFDRSTGREYVCLSTINLEEIKHYRLKAQDTGDIILLSESGLKIRFHNKPDIGVTNIKNIFRRAVYKK